MKYSNGKDSHQLEIFSLEQAIDANKQLLSENLHQYRKRQAIMEHPFGTIKRPWDFSYIMTK